MAARSIMIEQNTDAITKIKIKAARAGSAERMRRCRGRRLAGFRCFTVELHRGEIDTLVDRGLLQANEREDDVAVVDALSQHIEQTLGLPI
jgi:hypothetical protein